VTIGAILIVISVFLPLIYLSTMEANTRRYIIGINMASMPWMLIQTVIFVGLLYFLHYSGGFAKV
jgi:uncharacterized BrkB/YihY/UPF0761 family membrane protein